MKTALCPSCGQRKYSAARSSDGLCDACGGRNTAAAAQELVEREGEPPLCHHCGKGYLYRDQGGWSCPTCRMWTSRQLERVPALELFVRVVQVVLDPPQQVEGGGLMTHTVSLHLYGSGAKEWRDVPAGDYMLVRLRDTKGGQGENEG